MQNDEFRKDIAKRAIQLTISVIHLANSLPKTPAGFAISSQVIRSSSSIGANLHEAQSAGTRRDFTHCLTISLKEARETEYWLILISQTFSNDEKQISLLLKEIDEIIRILVSIVKKTKRNSAF